MKKKNKIQDGLKRNLTVTKERLEVGMHVKYFGREYVIEKIDNMVVTLIPADMLINFSIRLHSHVLELAVE